MIKLRGGKGTVWGVAVPSRTWQGYSAMDEDTDSFLQGDARSPFSAQLSEHEKNMPSSAIQSKQLGKRQGIAKARNVKGRRIDGDRSARSISQRARQNIEQEVARCLSLIRQGDQPLSSPVWLARDPDPVTRRSMPPMLNVESRLTGATDIRAERSGQSPAVFQVINTWTSIGTDGGQNKDDRTQRMTNPSEVRLLSPCAPPVPSREEASAFIPLFPKSIASVLRHWWMICPVEGVFKALVNFTKEERNKSTEQKKLYSKRKSVCLAFLHFVDLFGVAEYEKQFCSLRASFCFSKIHKKSARFLSEQRRVSNGALESDADMILFTERVCKKLNLRQKLRRRQC